MTLNCKIIKHEHIQQHMMCRVEKYEQISKLCAMLKKLTMQSKTETMN